MAISSAPPAKNDVEPLPSLEMHEAEVTFQAVVDPYARADFFLACSPEGLEIEEGFLTLTSLPGGLLAKVGKMKEQFGKVNTMHAHTLPWVDVPLVMKNLLGGEEGLDDSGVSVSKLLMNPLFFLEATGEVYQGNVRAVPDARAQRCELARPRCAGIATSPKAPTSTSAASFTQWAQRRRPRLHDAPVRRRRDGPLPAAAPGRSTAASSAAPSCSGAIAVRRSATSSAFGMYASGEYQFARRWFAGLRYDWSERAYDSSLIDKGPSLVLTYWPSEFSQIRGQYRRTRYAEGVTANEAAVPVPVLDRRARRACVLGIHGPRHGQCVAMDRREAGFNSNDKADLGRHHARWSRTLGRRPPLRQLNVVTTTEDLASLAREVGGDKVIGRSRWRRATRIRTSSRPSPASSSSCTRPIC